MKAYEALDRIKLPDESFSDVILRITGKKLSTSSLEDLARSIEEVHEVLNRIKISEEVLEKEEAEAHIKELREQSKAPGWNGADEIRKLRNGDKNS